MGLNVVKNFKIIGLMKLVSEFEDQDGDFVKLKLGLITVERIEESELKKKQSQILIR